LRNSCALLGTSAEPVPRRIEQEAVSEAGERSSIIKADKKAGKLVGPYLVGELIGEGTQGKVKEAVHSETLRRVAIKIVNKLQLRKIKNAEENMKRELKIHRRLKHEHVVELLEVLEIKKPDKEKQYIVLELINGGSLQDILDELPTHVLPVRLAARIGRQLFRGLEYIHSKGVVHRDIKPSNLMVTSDGVLKITDLGVAELLDEYAQDDTCSKSRGSPAFQPPEVASGSQQFSGFKVDVWASGVTLFLATSGRVPFEGSSLIQLFENISKGDFEMPTGASHPNFTSPTFCDFLRGLLKVSWTERLSTADALQHPWLSGADGGDASEDADEWSEERRRFVLGIARRGRASILKTIATSLDEEAPEDIRRHRRGSSKDAVEGCTLS
jgi:serine/threonine-protein kinase 11